MLHELDKSNSRMRGVSRPVQQVARELRRTMTPAEQALWEALRGQQLNGLKFRRQHPVGQFVLDFFCAAHKLVVELDGPIHDIQREQDAARSKHLRAYGYRVLRFRNEEVWTALPSVSSQIAEAAIAHPPNLNPRPSSGEGGEPQRAG